jgi:leucyl-tRNA synthetase
VEVFTTRPDTLFGATFVVLAPEHDLVDAVVPVAWPEGTRDAWTGGHTDPRSAVAAYRQQAAVKSDVERQTEGRDKTGVFTGAFATNPVNGERIPVFVADYVLMGYGTGAIMAVPGQDERDWEFATTFDLPIVRTVAPPEGWEGEAFTGDGPAVNSANDEMSLDGLGVAEAKARIIAWLEDKGLGRGTVTYKLRDWLFSRQRYWGEPFPVVFDEHGRVHAVPDDQLPVELPEVPDYAPRTFDPDDAQSDPEPPLGRVPEWVDVEMDLGDGPRRYRRETNTMPNWAGSCWYFIRYLDPANDDTFCDTENEAYWMGPRAHGAGSPDPGGVDLYVGGVEHAVLHLLYARFWQKVLHDLGHVTAEEPFRKYFSQGMIQAYAYRDARGQVVPADEVVPSMEFKGDPGSEQGMGQAQVFKWRGQQVSREHAKMGKSLKNVVTPDEMYDSYGADTFRVYEMSMGPLDVSRPWETRAVVGSLRFLQRLWRNVVDEETGECRVVDTPADDAGRRALHRAIDGVRHDYAGLRFNTAVAKLIELNNVVTRLTEVPRELVEPLVLMAAPVAPHVAEELWRRLGHTGSLAYEAFPSADPALLVEDTVVCVVQVQGKVRDRLEVPPSISEDELRERALASERVVAVLDGRDVRTVVVRAPKLVNIVPA